MDCSLYRPRLSLDISPEQQRKIQKYFPHGTIKLVFNCVIDDLIVMMEKYGSGVVIGSFIGREISLEALCGYDKKLEKVSYGDGVLERPGDNKERS